MNTLSSLGRKAREIFDREYRNRRKACAVAESQCPASWLLDEMVRLLNELPDAGRGQLQAAVRQRIELHSFHSGSGDTTFSPPSDKVAYRDPQKEAYVELLTDVLEQLREDADRDGQMSSTRPPAVPMFD